MKLHILTICTALLLLTACDKVAEDERLTYDTTINIDIDQAKGVLIEDFTGQNCPNCPDAHEVMDELKELYGKAVVCVSIHAGNFAYPEGQYGPNFPTFRTDESDKYAEPWNIVEYPTGIINRKSGKLKHQDWATYTYKCLEEQSHLMIDIKADYDSESNSIKIASHLAADKNIEGKYQLWIIEDSIVSIQKNGSTTIRDYVHNNVFRTSVNDIGGENITLQANEPDTLSHTIVKKVNWTAKNLKIVAFVYNNFGTEQVTEAKLNIPTE